MTKIPHGNAVAILRRVGSRIVGGITTIPVPPHALIADSIVEYFSPSTKQRLLMFGEMFQALPQPVAQGKQHIPKELW